MNTRVIALVAALNEGGTIAQVVTGIHPHVQSVVVVDDGSTDDTAMQARASGATVVSHDVNRGKGSAIRTGLAHILALPDVTHVLLLDGDMQHLPEEAPRLIAAAVQTNADLVVGERQFDREATPPSRYYANLLGSRVLSAFMGVPLHDTQCGYRLYKADMLRRLKLRATGYDIETEMLVKVGRLGGSVEHVPVTAIYHGVRSKLRPVRDTSRTCLRAIYYRYLERY